MPPLSTEDIRLAGSLRPGEGSAKVAAHVRKSISGFALRHRSVLIRVWKASVIGFSLVWAFLLRFDFIIPSGEVRHLKIGVAIALIAKMAVFDFFGVHRSWWRFTGSTDVLKLFGANAGGS